MMISSICFFIFSLIFSSSNAAVQDFCVADDSVPQSPTGYACKNTANVTVDDFVYSDLREPGQMLDKYNVGLKTAFSSQFPGLNGLGLSMVRGDFGVGGFLPMHAHTEASEIVHVVKGKMLAGMITSDNKVYIKNLKEGDMVVVPKGLLHFEANGGDTPAVVYASFSSDNPGLQIFQHALFRNDLPTELIAKTTLLDTAQIKKLKRLIGGTN